MNHISLNGQVDAIQRFFLSLPADPDGSVIELDGKEVARVMLAEAETNGSDPDNGPWTDAKNARRCELIDQEIDSKLTPAEVRELKNLQQHMLRHVHLVAPLPLEDARRLHQELLMPAQAANQG